MFQFCSKAVQRIVGHSNEHAMWNREKFRRFEKATINHQVLGNTLRARVLHFGDGICAAISYVADRGSDPGALDKRR
jgi:hypothetical protein